MENSVDPPPATVSLASMEEKMEDWDTSIRAELASSFVTGTSIKCMPPTVVQDRLPIVGVAVAAIKKLTLEELRTSELELSLIVLIS
jgi:hypothetical protein